MNSSWLSVHPVYPVWVIILLIFPLFLFFLWKESQRPHKFRMIRLIAQVLVLISVLGTFFRPMLQKERKSEWIILLTPGFDKIKADSALKANPSAKVFRTQRTEDFLSSITLKSWNDLTEMKGLGLILGEGLPYFALELVQGEHFKFIPAKHPIGINRLILPKKIYPNQTNTIQGTFHAEKPTQLKLESPGGVEDSVMIIPKGVDSFSLSFKPKHSGLFTYDITTQVGSGNKHREKIPIHVEQERKLKILFLQKFPTAEVRFLKNYLVQKGHSLALRYQVSKNNFRYEYANLDTRRLDRLTADLIEEFDLVFTDGDVVDQLSSDEKRTLESSIQKGLGVIVLLNDIPPSGRTINRVLSFKQKKGASDKFYFGCTMF